MYRCVTCALVIAAVIAGSQSCWASDWPFWFKAEPGQPNTLEQVGCSIDCIEAQILDDGVVVTKQPDVYGQSRMTIYRKNFEQQMYSAINNFNVVLSARVARSDQAAFLSQSNLQAALTSSPAAGRGRTARGGSAGAASSNTTVVTPTTSGSGSGSGSPGGGDSSGGSSSGIVPNALAENTISRSGPFSGLGGQPFSNMGGAYGLGLEPTIYLDQLANFQSHLNDIRRINMGDDIADAAGYGLYLLRIPISIQPGHCTGKGHGAILQATIRHDFGPDFLYTTMRNLVINDLVDQLTPVVYELIRSNSLDSLTEAGSNKKIETYYGLRKRYRHALEHLDPGLLKRWRCYLIFLNDKDISNLNSPPVKSDCEVKKQSYQAPYAPLQPYTQEKRTSEPSINDTPEQILTEAHPEGFGKAMDAISRMTPASMATTRSNERSYPVAATEVDNVFIEQNLVVLAFSAKAAIQTKTPRASDVRAFLRRELESAYDVISQLYGGGDDNAAHIVSQFEENVEQIARHVRNREWFELYHDYDRLTRSLPGFWGYLEKKDPRSPNMTRSDPYDAFINPTTICCYATAVEAGLLDQQLRVDMKRVLGKEGADGNEIDGMRFYSRYPGKEVEEKFQEYIKKRWPVITFAVDPFVDEQNIADATSIRRDLQLALAFAFSTGQINFRQLLQFQRRIEFDAETIALNRTITSFSHGNDTFGFRFTPRYQNPPPEKNNFQVLYNQVVKGGLGRYYQIDNSKLEAGQRELTAVVIMPSFLQSVKMDVTGNWFGLRNPEHLKIPTPRMLEEEHKVVELNEALACIHDHKQYRGDTVDRLATRVHQIEAMLPMQTHEVRVPYENTLGGFALFQQGTTSLVPHLDGFEGAEAIEEGKDVELMLFGKHFSVQETHVIVGGKYLTATDLDAQKSLDAAKASVDAASASNDAAQISLTASFPTAPSSQQGKDSSASDTSAGGTKSGTTPSSGGQKGGSTTSSDGTPSKVASANSSATAAHSKAASGHLAAAKKSVSAAGTKAGAGNVASSLTGATTPANPSVDVISREVLRISIPSGVLKTIVLDADGKTQQTYVEIFVATPNGISNRLLVPFQAAGDTAKAQKPSFGYTLGSSALKITYSGGPVTRDAQGKLLKLGQLQFDPKLSDQTLTITLESDFGIAPTIIDSEFEATIAGDNQKTTFNVNNIPGKKGVYKLQVKDLAEAIQKDTTAFGKIMGNLDSNPTLPVTVYLTPRIRVFDQVLDNQQAGGGDVEIIRSKANGDLVLTIQLNPIPMPSGPSSPRASDSPNQNQPHQAGPSEGEAAPPPPEAPDNSGARLAPPPGSRSPFAPLGAPHSTTTRKDNRLKRSSYVPAPRPPKPPTAQQRQGATDKEE
ncbi:MAG: hypothetical protein ACLP7Q_07865 [Isosphaeraceae bacterium]